MKTDERIATATSRLGGPSTWVPMWAGLLVVLFLFPTPVFCDMFFRVRHVTDGDTIVLQNGRIVRYIGIDAPEIAYDGQPGQPFGSEAHRLNIQLVWNRQVRLEWDVEKTDRFGRTLAYVFLPDGTFVNQALVESGMAMCMPTAPNHRREHDLKQAQRRAIQQEKGIWKSVATHSGPMIGNRHSKRFHSPECPDGKNISRKNRIGFPGNRAAFEQGYYPCRRCLGNGLQ